VIGVLQSQGWGNGGVFQIDFSIGLQRDPGSTSPLQTFTTTKDFYSPDCDHVPMPVPVGGSVEGENGYACTHNGDCHLIVLRGTTLYEMWRANITSSGFAGGCLAVWDTTKVYGPSERGDQCTSADAAGYPISALLFTADEVKAGTINHAIRFILPNDHIRNGVYLHPSTHSTGATAGPTGSIPYGGRLRLKNTTTVNTKIAAMSAGAQVVARALQKYGMFLADGGEIALTAAADKFTTAKWSGLLGPTDLQALDPQDFDMIDGGTRINYTGDCVRN
jgi:serine/threonine-protein kinase